MYLPRLKFLDKTRDLVIKLPRDQSFACSNRAEVDGFLPDVKILSTSPPGGTFNRHIHVLVIP